MLESIKWPENFPDIPDMLELLRITSKSSWQNEEVFNSDNINKWLDNFSGKVYEENTERRLALWLLCNFTFYNKNEIDHLCHIVFKKYLHIVANSCDIKSDDELQHLFDNTYFAAMGGASESGGLLLYYFRQQSNLSLDKFYYPAALPKNENGIIVFIDDVTLSGDSASRFLKNNIGAMIYHQAYYLTLFASDEAISNISEQGVEVIQATILGNRERCFTKESLIFASFPELREPSERIAYEYGLRICPDKPLGYKNGQYCFGLFYNTPNNSLPIFWSSRQWAPIFARKEKRYHDWKRYDYDKYI